MTDLEPGQDTWPEAQEITPFAPKTDRTSMEQFLLIKTEFKFIIVELIVRSQNQMVFLRN